MKELLVLLLFLVSAQSNATVVRSVTGTPIHIIDNYYVQLKTNEAALVNLLICGRRAMNTYPSIMSDDLTMFMENFRDTMSFGLKEKKQVSIKYYSVKEVKGHNCVIDFNVLDN